MFATAIQWTNCLAMFTIASVVLALGETEKGDSYDTGGFPVEYIVAGKIVNRWTMYPHRWIAAGLYANGLFKLAAIILSFRKVSKNAFTTLSDDSSLDEQAHDTGMLLRGLAYVTTWWTIQFALEQCSGEFLLQNLLGVSFCTLGALSLTLVVKEISKLIGTQKGSGQEEATFSLLSTALTFMGFIAMVMLVWPFASEWIDFREANVSSTSPTTNKMIAAHTMWQILLGVWVVSGVGYASSRIFEHLPWFFKVFNVFPYAVSKVFFFVDGGKSEQFMMDVLETATLAVVGALLDTEVLRRYGTVDP